MTVWLAWVGWAGMAVWLAAGAQLVSTRLMTTIQSKNRVSMVGSPSTRWATIIYNAAPVEKFPGAVRGGWHPLARMDGMVLNW